MARKVTFSWLERDEDLIKWYDTASTSLSGASVGSSSINNPTNAGAVFTMSSEGPNRSFAPPGQKYCVINTYTMDDVDIEAESQFETPESMIPWSGFLNTLGNIQSKVSGTSPEILNFMKVPTWQSTSPLQLNFQVNFYSMTDSILDVLLPTLSLLSLTILKRVKVGETSAVYQVPGVFMGNMGDALYRSVSKAQESGTTDSAPAENEKEKKSLDAIKAMSNEGQGRFFSVNIENLIQLDHCLLEAVKPKISRQQTSSGGPLWAMVDLKIKTLLPASTGDLLKQYQQHSADSSKVTKTFS